MRWQSILVFGISVFSFLVIFLAGVWQAQAAILVIDSSQSQITASGQVGGYTFTAQGPGSLTAVYRGSVNATVSGSIIQFTGSSAIAAIRCSARGISDQSHAALQQRHD